MSRRPLRSLLCVLGGLNPCLPLTHHGRASIIKATGAHFSSAFQQNHHLSSNYGIVIHPVESASDIQDLADLRYDEWMANDEDDGTATTNTVSRHAFRCATAEIHEERIAEGAVAFLARLTVGDNQAVGAAELSPIELQGAILYCHSTSSSSSNNNCNSSHNYRNNRFLYVTDVLTAKGHRRKGVARALLQAMEEYADPRVAGTTLLDNNMPIQHSSSPSAVVLLLHVEPSNHAALKFYRKLQYDINNSNLQASVAAFVAIDDDCRLDCDRLAENAGAVGQVLLAKVLNRKSASLSSSTKTDLQQHQRANLQQTGIFLWEKRGTDRHTHFS